MRDDAKPQQHFRWRGSATTQIVELDLIDQRATHELVVLTQLIKDHLHRIDPDIILTHPYEGGHPDHDATAFAVHAALRQWEGEKMPPQLFELTSYHDHNGQTIRSDLLPAAHCPAVTFKLSSAQRDLKRRMFECFLTQREVLRWFPIAIERFRRAPSYDFTRAPHCGKLHFESFDWGMDGEHWRSLAQQALDALGQSHEPSERPPEGGLAPA